MSDAVWIAIVSCVSTVAVTLGSVMIAYFKLKEGQTVIRGHVNGLLTREGERTDEARAQVVEVAKTAIKAQVPTHVSHGEHD